MNHRGRGLVFIISAPSGTGKTTLVRRVMELLPGLRFSVSYTTRSPRTNEKEGEDYHFVSPSVFQEMVKRGDFLEWAEVLGNYYGTIRFDREALASEGMDLILDIDTQGARKVMETLNHPIPIYILPPSLEALQERLVKRGLDSAEMIRFRMANARKDMEEAQRYQYVIVNESVDDTVETLKAIMIAERCRKCKVSILEEKKRQ